MQGLPARQPLDNQIEELIAEQNLEDGPRKRWELPKEQVEPLW